ncbi:hypothetical protein BV25DRAFT_1885432 [Artomyces pyxidatus]|uniref:Uncharacterized protein n=1 Tax=Artomyces pyxidatus TaxID=48021 RepID=A0ACB8T0E3_9AGAM|nr:hypothetical protein BV25DRAFT_1885432 [Artomyces pyxidatus]
MALHRGDDLDDDFMPDDIVALSEGGSLVGDPDDIAKLLSEDEDADPAHSPPHADNALADKKRKRREKEKERKLKKRKLAETTEPAELPSVAAQPPALISDYLSSVQEKTFPKLSAIELQDRQVPETSIADTTEWTGSRNLDNLVDFIVKVVPSLHARLSQRTKSPGAPTLLFLAGAALRVVDVTRTLRSKTLRGEKGGEVAKLFSKHFKVEEHVRYLKRTKVGSAVGTPGRIGKLLCDTDALTVSALTHIILDVSYRDAKKRSLLDIPETRDEVFKTVLGAPQVLQAIQAGKIQIVLF